MFSLQNYVFLFVPYCLPLSQNIWVLWENTSIYCDDCWMSESVEKKYNIKSFNWERWGKCRHRVDWPINKLDTERHSIRNVLDSQIFQEVLLLVPQDFTIFVYFSFVCCCLSMCVFGGGGGKTWPSLNIISTAFNCSHDTESEYIWLWFMGSYLYGSIWYFQKMTPFWFLIAWKTKQLILKWELYLYRIWWNKPHQNMFSNNLPYIYQNDKTAHHNNISKHVDFVWSFTCCKLAASLAIYFLYCYYVKGCTASPVYICISVWL